MNASWGIETDPYSRIRSMSPPGPMPRIDRQAHLPHQPESQTTAAPPSPPAGDPRPTPQTLTAPHC